MVIWITGLSGSGKTTVANAIIHLAKINGRKFVLIDGDIIREIYGNDLDFDESSRKIQISRIQKLTHWLSHQEVDVVVAALYSNESILKWNREFFQKYFEVYLNTPQDIIELRDSKGLYKRARCGELKNVVGIDIQWIEPVSPDMRISSYGEQTPSYIARQILMMSNAISSFESGKSI